MFLDKFKTSKKIDLSKPISAYIKSHYDMNAVKCLEPMLNEIDFARNEAINVANLDKSVSSMEKAKISLVNYLKLLSSLRQRMTFGKDNMSVKIEFAWFDVLKNTNYFSYNISHEYYNMLFNLALCLFNLGKSCDLNSDETVLKQSIKNLNYSAWIFDKIKQELPQNLSANDIQPDLQQSYLTYCSYYSLAHSQILIFLVSDRKKMNLELQAQLTKGIYDLFSSCLQGTEEGLKNYSDKIIKTFLNNRRFYYFSQGFMKLKEVAAEDIKNKGSGYGKMIAYASLAKDSLNSGIKDIKLINNIVDEAEYYSKIKDIENELVVMNRKNKEIYYEAVPNAATLPKIEKKIMANPAIYPEDFNNSENYKDALKDLVPKEVKENIGKYKASMMEFISKNLARFQNESSIDKFLNDMNLPGVLESSLNQNSLSDYLWEKIYSVQQKGGSLFLESNIKNLEGLKDDISKKISTIQQLLQTEAEDDNKYRQIYGSKWYRQPSCNLNNVYVGQINQYSDKLKIANSCDQKVIESIRESTKHFDLINLSKASIERKIPIKVESDCLLNIEEAKSLKASLDKLRDLQCKNRELTEKIFLTINEENVIPHFLGFIKKAASETNFMKEQHEKYNAMFEEIEKLEKPIEEAKNEVIKNNEEFLKIKDSKLKPKKENEDFFKEIEGYCNLYNQKLTNLYQGMNFYSELVDKLDSLNSSVSDFMFSRDLEKNDIIKQMGGKPVNPNQFHDFSGRKFIKILLIIIIIITLNNIIFNFRK